MKVDRKTKVDSNLDEVKTKSKSRRGSSKSGAKTKGKHPLAAYEHIPVGIVEVSLDGRYMDVNGEFCRILGYSRQELLQLGIKDCTHEDDYALDTKLYEQLVAGTIPFYRLEKRFLRKDGRDIWVELTRTVVCDEKGKPRYTVGVVLDISDRKDVERALRESVERLRLATGAAQMFMWEWDFQTQSYILADNFEKVLGFSAGLLPRNKFETVWALSPQEDVQKVSEAFEKAVEQQRDLYALPYRVINPENGQVIWLEISAKIVYDGEGNPQRMFGVAQNITESKKVQDEIAVISRMPEENPNPVMRLTPEGHVLYANAPSRVMLESWKQQGDQTIPAELQMSITEAFTAGMKEEIEITQGGKMFSCTLAPILDAGYINFYANDITERNKALEELRVARERAERLADRTARLQKITAALSEALSPVQVAEVIVQQGTSAFGSVSSSLMVLSEDAQSLDLVYSTNDEALTRPYKHFPVSLKVPAADAARTNQLIWIESQQQYLKRYPHLADQIHRWGQQAALAIPMIYKGRILGVLTLSFGRVLTQTVEDEDYALTLARQGAQALERARAEEALRESEERFRAIISQTTAGISESDLDGRLVFVNPRFCEMLGYPEEDLLGKTIWELTYTEDLEENKRLFQRMLKPGTPYQFEKRFIRKDGSKLWASVSVTTIHDSTGKPRGGVGVVLDIHSRKQAEEALAEFARQQAALYKLSDQLHRADSLPDVFDAALDAIFSALQCDRASILLYDNTDVMRFVAWRGLSDDYRKATDGHSPWTPEAKDPQPINMDDVRAADLDESLRAVIQGEGIGALAFIPLVVHKKLIGKFMVYYDTPHTFEEAELELSLTIAHQLAFGVDRKRTEQALQGERELLERLFETMPVMVSMYDSETNSMRLNAEFERRVGWKTGDVSIVSLLESVYPDPNYRAQVVQRMAAAGRNDWVDVQMRTRQGRTLDSIWSNISILNGRQIGIGIDISERKETEKRLALLAEISEMLRNFDDPYELMYSISKAVGEHLHVKRALFNEIDLEHDREIVHRDYHDGWDSVAGIHNISDYSSITSQEVAAGKTVVNVDSKTDPRTVEEYEKTYALTGERAYVVVPLMREYRWVASLWVSDDMPRKWTREEVSLLETVAERTWIVIEKLRMNTALRESEQRYRAVVESQSEMLCRFQPDGTILFANGAYARARGATSEELASRNFWEFIAEADRPPVQAMLDSLTPEAPQVQIENRFHTVGGERWTLWTNRALSFDAQGRWLEAQSSGIDITERKQVEEALAHERELLNRIFESIPVMLTIYDPSTKLLRLNKQFEQLIGWSSEQAAGISLMEAIYPDPDYRENVGQFMERCAENEWMDIQMRTRDGRTLETSWSNIRLSNDMRVGIGIDITERKRSEEALRRNEQMVSTLVNAAPFGVYFIDSEFRLRSIYKGAEAVFSGIDPLIGRDFAEILRIVWKEPFATQAIERFRHTLRTGESYLSPPIVEERANFEEIEAYDWQIHRITLNDGTFGVVCYFYDLSEQKRMEATVRASETLYRTIARNIPGGGVYVVDKDFRYLVAEGPVTEAFGLTREMLEGHTVAEVFPDERGERMESRLRRNFAGETVSFETKHNGRVFWTQQAPLSDSLGQAIILTLDISERKQAEEALRQSEERFARFMHHLPGLAWIKDMQGRYVYANAAAEQAFNSPREILYGKTDEEIFAPDVAAQFRRNDQQALTDEKGVQMIETLKHVDGILHYSLVNKFPIPGPDGTPTLIAGTAFDITERLRAEDALRESEERFRAILRQATAGIVRKDADGCLIFVNQAFCNMLGRTEADLLGKTIWDFMHEEDIVQNKQSFERLMKEGIPFKLERRLIREDGSVIWVDASVSPIMDATGKPQSAVAVEVDITGRKQAEEALQQLNFQLEERVLIRTAKLRAVNQTLREEIAERQRVEEALRQSEATARENEEKLRTLFELLPVGISFLDLGGQVIQMNSALANILKVPKGTLSDQIYRSRKYIRANGTLMPSAEFASRRALTEGRTIYNVETGVVLESSEVIWTSVSAAPVDVADVGAVVVTVDITESKLAERALQESRERLQILSQRLVEVQEEERRAIARELHDRVGQTLAALNINLIIISGQLGGKVDEQTSSRLNDSMKLVAETIALVRDVMSNLRPSVLDDYGLEAAIESHLSQYVSRYAIETKFEKPAEPIPRLVPSMEMTFLRIAQEALMNIARHAHASQINLSLWQEGNTVCMLIQDNGQGITSWESANRPGSHGLTIMRERAEAFGGSLKVSSIPGKGTTVEVKIPMESNIPSQDQKEISQ